MCRLLVLPFWPINLPLERPQRAGSAFWTRTLQTRTEGCLNFYSVNLESVANLAKYPHDLSLTLRWMACERVLTCMFQVECLFNVVVFPYVKKAISQGQLKSREHNHSDPGNGEIVIVTMPCPFLVSKPMKFGVCSALWK